jgi:hypothetical protein
MSQYKNLTKEAILTQLFEDDDDGLHELDPQGNDCTCDSADEEAPVPDRIILGDGDEDEPVSPQAQAEVEPVLTPPLPNPRFPDIFFAQSRSASPTVMEPPTKRSRLGFHTASGTVPVRLFTRDNSGSTIVLENMYMNQCLQGYRYVLGRSF